MSLIHDDKIHSNGILLSDQNRGAFLDRKTFAQRCADVFRPALLTRSKRGRPGLRRTAHLDGIRGFAALIVYIGHHQLWARDSINIGTLLENGYGFNKQYFFACLPFVRTFFSGGHLSVCLFFAISGYVLSAKALAFIHAEDHQSLSRNLSSALFRRAPRLYLPVIVVTFIYLTVWHAFGVWPEYPVRKETYFAEIRNWADELRNLTFIFRDTGIPWLSYNFHVWSIPVEFRGSITIYVALLTFSTWSSVARLLGECGLMFYFMYIVNAPSLSVFISGMLLCDLDLLALEDKLPKLVSQFAPYQNSIANILFVVGLYLGGVPSSSSEMDDLRNTPGWYYLSYLKPRVQTETKHFYLFWAAIFLLFSIPRIRPIKSFFETRFCQYLGHISYMFYLVHGPILWTLGDRLYAATGWTRNAHEANLPHWINIMPLSKDGPLGLDLAFWAPQILLLPLTFWLAEILTRLVDQPSVRFSQWLYDRVSSPVSKRG